MDARDDGGSQQAIAWGFPAWASGCSQFLVKRGMAPRPRQVCHRHPAERDCLAPDAQLLFRWGGARGPIAPEGSWQSAGCRYCQLPHGRAAVETSKASHVRNKPGVGNSATLTSAQDKSVRIFAMRQLEIEPIQLDYRTTDARSIGAAERDLQHPSPKLASHRRSAAIAVTVWPFSLPVTEGGHPVLCEKRRLA
jgi:hypothetical protein